MNERLRMMVVGFDFSKPALEAVRVSVDLARRSGARVRLLTALPGHLQSSILLALEPDPSPSETPYEYESRLQEHAAAHIRNALAEIALDGVDFDIDLSLYTGSRKPFARLLAAADRHQADLVVVGATGQGKLQRFLVGSTAEKLVRKSRFPVLVVKPGHAQFLRVMCAVDFSEASRVALEWAAAIASLADGEVHIVHVSEPVVSPQVEALVGIGRLAAVEVERLRAEALAYARVKMGELTGEIAFGTAAVSIHFLEGHPDFEIVKQAEELNADLVCMGSLGRDWIQGMVIGNTAERVLRSLPASVLAVKPDAFVLKHKFFGNQPFEG